jgi:pyridoxamine 5'-phosphate oxidase
MTKKIINPFLEFAGWFAEATSHPNIEDATAMSLATVAPNHHPSLRIVLMKDVTKNGFIFYTNLASRKALEIIHNNNAALCFYWMPIMKQVRVEGKLKKVSNSVADKYFASRPRESQISAWASRQSATLKDPNDFEQKMQKITKDFENKKIPRPPFWSGFELIADNIEFWESRDFRRHIRRLYTKTKNNNWEMKYLYP